MKRIHTSKHIKKSNKLLENSTPHKHAYKVSSVLKKEGIVSLAKGGFGFVRAVDEDIFIPQSKMRGYLPGDMVVCILDQKRSEKGASGSIEKRIREGKRNFVVSFASQDDFEKGAVTECCGSLPFPILVANKSYFDSMDNNFILRQKFLITITSYSKTDEYPTGLIISHLGPSGDHETEIQSILANKGISNNFPSEVLREAKNCLVEISTVSKDTRKDMTGSLTCTIDPHDAKDFDDALSFEEKEDVYIVGVHIADVSWYVKENSELDREAKKRSFSTYLVDRTIPMLPEALSNDVCSLNPHQQKNTFSVLYTIKKDTFVIDSFEITKTTIFSDRRFSYEQAQGIIDGTVDDTLWSRPLTLLNTLAIHMREKRLKNGLEFSDDEIKFSLGKSGEVESIYKKQRFDAHKMIEEWMLIANKTIAEYFVSQKQKLHGFGVFRSHDLPNEEKVSVLARFVSTLGFSLPPYKEPSIDFIHALQKSIVGTDYEVLVSRLLVRSMAKATYTVTSTPHFGLGYTHYTHFTSPIRRYPDLLVHRLLSKLICNDTIPQHWKKEWKNDIEHANTQEINIVGAERDSIAFKQAEYMSKFVGTDRKTTITSVTDFGIFLEDSESFAEGLVRLSTLHPSYEYVPQKYAYESSVGLPALRIGVCISAKLVGVHVELRQIDFELIQ